VDDETLQDMINACYEEMRLKGISMSSVGEHVAVLATDSFPTMETIWFNHVYYQRQRHTENDEWSKWTVRP